LGVELCRNLLEAGYEVRILDNNSRGDARRLTRLDGSVEFVEGDVRDYHTVLKATEGCEEVWHLAYVNGTKFFYEKPDLVLDVGIKGAIHTLDAALSRGVKRYVLASTSETYNVPTVVPTPETERLIVPDVTNPRFSYGGGKIACELLTLHYGMKRGLEAVIFRPHNFFGPDMGFEHVIPELVKKIGLAADRADSPPFTVEIQGTGQESRSFCHVRDGATGAFLAGTKGESGNIYHVGTSGTITIESLALKIAAIMDTPICIKPGPLLPGSTDRRCPDISKLSRLGYAPVVDFDQGLRETVEWYVEYYGQSNPQS
jgi:nucleoside-diphosphate-sugar epimerase